MAIAALSLRISLTNAFVYANWADAMSYAEGARRVLRRSLAVQRHATVWAIPARDAAIMGHGFVYPPSGAYVLAPFTLDEPFFYFWNALSYVVVIWIVLLMVRREVGRRLSVPMAFAVGAMAVIAFQVGLPGAEDWIRLTGRLSSPPQ